MASADTLGGVMLMTGVPKDMVLFVVLSPFAPNRLDRFAEMETHYPLAAAELRHIRTQEEKEEEYRSIFDVARHESSDEEKKMGHSPQPWIRCLRPDGKYIVLDCRTNTVSSFACSSWEGTGLSLTKIVLYALLACFIVVVIYYRIR